MAGFEVTLYGRIWVTPKALSAIFDLSLWETTIARSPERARIGCWLYSILPLNIFQPFQRILSLAAIHAEGLLIRAESAVDSLQPKNFGQFGWARCSLSRAGLDADPTMGSAGLRS
jgi:hypothetical protein